MILRDLLGHTGTSFDPLNLLLLYFTVIDYEKCYCSVKSSIDMGDKLGILSLGREY